MQQFRNIRYKHKQNNCGNIVLNIDGIVHHKGKIIADNSNCLFLHTIASKLVSKLPRPTHVFPVTSRFFRQFHADKNVNNNTLVLQPLSEDFIYKELRNLNIDKSTGLDDIPARFLKNDAFYIKEPIMSIINKSVATGIVPEDFKKGRVKPLFKKGNSL